MRKPQPLYEKMSADSELIADRDLKMQVWSVIDSAKYNADETIYAERAAPENEWERLFKGSMVDILSSSNRTDLAPLLKWLFSYGVTP
jgi:hypothetical protein